MVAPGAVTAVVVMHDSAGVIAPCLDALQREGAGLLAVDNASTDASTAVAEARGATVLRQARNQGYGRANNRGARAATGEWLLIVNPDLVLDPGALAVLLAAAARVPEAAILAPRIVEPDGRVFLPTQPLLAGRDGGGPLPIPESEAPVPAVSGACLLIRRAFFLDLGGFDETIFLFYEDDDLCRRVTDAGRSILYVPEATARHGRGRSSAPGPGRVFRSRWHQAWSRAYVSRKYGLPDPAPGLLARNAPKALGAALLANRGLAERYGGSAAGALAWLRGVTALAHEGLDGKRAP